MMQGQTRHFGDQVVYQIYPKSFSDSTGSGTGDLRGITNHLDYLASLGVDYLWLTPFFVSPQNDNGYDVADYRKVDEAYGTMEDFKDLVRQAEKRGLGIMVDMVFNHTSTSHEWFRRALAGEKKYQDYYFFRAGDPSEPPTNWKSKFGGSAWQWVPSLGKWYLHLFDVTQADLNWENPELRAELVDIVKFWKQEGVRGFRFDVINLISKPERFIDDDTGDGRRFYTDGPRVHEYLRELVSKSGINDMITVGEMSSTSIENCVLYSRPESRELSMTFSFHHLKIDYLNGSKWELAEPDIVKLRSLFCQWQERMQAGGGWNALFWSNHDQPRPVSRFGDDQRYWLVSAKMLATCIHLMQGTPYIYQGEELGMTNPSFSDISQYRDVESLNYYRILLKQGKSKQGALKILACRSRDNSRTPMQWSAGENAGFTTGKPWIEVCQNYKRINAEEEIDDPRSVWDYYHRLIQLRKKMPLISRGDIHFIDAGCEKVIAYLRCLEKERLLVLCSFSDEQTTVRKVSVPANSKCLIGNYSDTAVPYGNTLVLRPYEALAFIWY
jgi:trehalose-6-phosphate hydrolase